MHFCITSDGMNVSHRIMMRGSHGFLFTIECELFIDICWDLTHYGFSLINYNLRVAQNGLLGLSHSSKLAYIAVDHFIGYLSSDQTAPAVADKIVLTALNDCGYCKSDYCGIKNDPNICT